MIKILYNPPTSKHSSVEQALVLFNVPDGHVKEMPTSGSKHKNKQADDDKVWHFFLIKKICLGFIFLLIDLWEFL